jgi:hypothetical protein
MGAWLFDTKSPLAQLTLPLLTERISPRMGEYMLSDVNGWNEVICGRAHGPVLCPDGEYTLQPA